MVSAFNTCHTQTLLQSRPAQLSSGVCSLLHCPSNILTCSPISPTAVGPMGDASNLCHLTVAAALNHPSVTFSISDLWVIVCHWERDPANLPYFRQPGLSEPEGERTSPGQENVGHIIGARNNLRVRWQKS